MSLVVIVSRFEILALFFLTPKHLSYSRTILVPGGMRTPRSWKVRIPPAASSPLHRSPFSALPSFSRTPRASEARTRAKLRGNGCFFDRGGWAAWSEPRAA